MQTSASHGCWNSQHHMAQHYIHVPVMRSYITWVQPSPSHGCWNNQHYMLEVSVCIAPTCVVLLRQVGKPIQRTIICNLQHRCLALKQRRAALVGLYDTWIQPCKHAQPEPTTIMQINHAHDPKHVEPLAPLGSTMPPPPPALPPQCPSSYVSCKAKLIWWRLHSSNKI